MWVCLKFLDLQNPCFRIADYDRWVDCWRIPFVCIDFFIFIFCVVSCVCVCVIFSKAIEKASENRAIVEALGEPIVRGPWYSASLAVAHKRHSVSCTFPVSGPQGTGIFQLKAIRQGGMWHFLFVSLHSGVTFKAISIVFYMFFFLNC